MGRNEELFELFRHKNIVRFVRKPRLWSLSHIERIGQAQMVKRVYDCEYLENCKHSFLYKENKIR